MNNMTNQINGRLSSREYSRRMVIIFRRHGIGRHPLTGELPRNVPTLDGSYRNAALSADLAALSAEFGGAFAGQIMRQDWDFSGSELAE